MSPVNPSILSEFARKVFTKKKSDDGTVEVPEGFEKCPDCGDIKTFNRDHPGFHCETCGGCGYVDWVENILGPKEKHEPGIFGGSHTHHMHSHIGNITGSVITTVGAGESGYYTTAPMISEIKAGPGINISEGAHSHICGVGGMASAVSEPTISVDIQSIKKELMTELEEHISNEVSKRVAQELLRRGIK